MNLSARTILVLKNFASINASMQFRKGNILSTMASNKTIFARANVDQEFPQDFAIYDLARFLNAISLFDKAELAFEDKFVRISADRQHINYTYCDPKAIVSPPVDKQPKLPPAYVQCTLSAEVLSACLKAAAILKVPEIAVVGNGSRLSLKAINVKNPTMDTFSVELGETDKTCNFVFDTSKILLIPATYNVTIGVGKNVSALFDSGEQSYFIAVNDTSTYE